MSDAPVEKTKTPVAPVAAAAEVTAVPEQTKTEQVISLKELLAQVAAEAVKAANKAAPKPVKAPPKLCPVCNQRLDQCKNEHTRINMTISEFPFRKYYRGQTLNGVRYAGPNCIVPTEAVGELLAAQDAWLRQQRSELVGRDTDTDVTKGINNIR